MVSPFRNHIELVGIPDRGFRRCEHHVDDGRRPADGRLAPEVFRRELVERQVPAEHLGDHLNPLLGQFQRS